MKRKSGFKQLLGFVTAVTLMLFSAQAALAGTSTNSYQTYPGNDVSDLLDRLQNILEFKFWNYADGIGYGNCPVYTAPYDNAFRCANGKASCQTNDKMGEGGFFSGWLLVRYETSNGGVRVGYIPPKYVKGFKSKMGTPQFDYIPVTADQSIIVTDNPIQSGTSFAILDPGETFYILGKYTYVGDWWYIECTVDDQPARGFIDRSTSSFYLGDYNSGDDASVSDSAISLQTLGIPEVSPLGTERIGKVSIGYGDNGDRKAVRKNPNPNAERVTSVYPGKEYPCYAVQRGSTGKDWYYIWIEVDSDWGWVSSAFATFYSDGDD